jgi:magnesium-transporting ATPase (P-type)
MHRAGDAGVAVQFNEINSRKLGDQLNIFDGIWRNPVFLSVIAITLAFQVVIMQTPVSSVFHVQPQTWQEWVIAVGIGAGSTIACLLSKLLLRSAAVSPLTHTSDLIFVLIYYIALFESWIFVILLIKILLA